MKRATFSSKKLSFIALWTAILCVTSPFSIPVFNLPITFSTIALSLAAVFLGAGGGCVAVVIYILIGLVGLPVFTGFTGGVGALLGPTGGYIIGYVGFAFIVGTFSKKQTELSTFISFILGNIFIYFTGSAWYLIITECNVLTAVSVCVLPFVLIDIIKGISAVILFKYLKPVALKLCGG